MTSSPVKSIGTIGSGSSSLACPADSVAGAHVGTLGISVSGGSGVANCTGVSGGASGGPFVSLTAQAQVDNSAIIIVAVVIRSILFFIPIVSPSTFKIALEKFVEIAFHYSVGSFFVKLFGKQFTKHFQ